MTKVYHSRASDEWSTPDALFEGLHREFGFTVDAAATSENAKCSAFWTAEEDGLTQAWAGHVVWCNPPYSRLAEWLARAARAAQYERTTCVLLIPARTDTKAWHAHVWDEERHRPRRGVEIRFIKGRVRFGESNNGAPFPSAVVIFHARKD